MSTDTRNPRVSDATPRHPVTGRPLTGAARIAHERGARLTETQARRAQLLAFRAQILKAAARRQAKETA